MRQIILDTETTGLSPALGHRIIEIGCVELINRRLTGKTFQTYLQPDRNIDEGAIRVHGITADFLVDKPRFRDIVVDFMQFIKEAELIIHNAPFDVGFLEYEFSLINQTTWIPLHNQCAIFDTLYYARQKHPGQKNNLDALCKRYEVDNQHRQKHGALLDAEILAEVYLAMTGGQESLSLDEGAIEAKSNTTQSITHNNNKLIDIPFLPATSVELQAHETFLDNLEAKNAVKSVWREIVVAEDKL